MNEGIPVSKGWSALRVIISQSGVIPLWTPQKPSQLPYYFHSLGQLLSADPSVEDPAELPADKKKGPFCLILSKIKRSPATKIHERVFFTTNVSPPRRVELLILRSAPSFSWFFSTGQKLAFVTVACSVFVVDWYTWKPGLKLARKTEIDRLSVLQFDPLDLETLHSWHHETNSCFLVLLRSKNYTLWCKKHSYS